MKLSKVTQYFNNTDFFDSYTNEKLGAGQLDVFDESKRDGLTAQRRIFEVAPGTPLPPRLAIQFHGLNWLVGVTEIDAFKGSVIREKHVLHQAEGLAKLWTVRQMLDEVDPLEVYAARVWTKSTSEVEISSGKFNQLQIFTSRAETIVDNSLIEISGYLHTVMTSYPASAGHLTTVVEQLDAGAVEVGTIEGVGKWDPIEETYGPGSTPIRLVKLRWQTDFEYFSQATETFKRGDMQAASLTAPTNGTVVTLADGLWNVISSQPRNEVQYLHLRRGGNA